MIQRSQNRTQQFNLQTIIFKKDSYKPNQNIVQTIVGSSKIGNMYMDQLFTIISTNLYISYIAEIYLYISYITRNIPFFQFDHKKYAFISVTSLEPLCQLHHYKYTFISVTSL